MARSGGSCKGDDVTGAAGQITCGAALCREAEERGATEEVERTADGTAAIRSLAILAVHAFDEVDTFKGAQRRLISHTWGQGEQMMRAKLARMVHKQKSVDPQAYCRLRHDEFAPVKLFLSKGKESA